MARVVVFVAVLAVLLAVCFFAHANAEDCPQADVRPESWAQSVVSALNSLPESSLKMDFLKVAVENDTRVFNGAEMVRILQCLDSAGDKVQATQIMTDYVVGLNASEIVSVLEELNFSEDRMTVLGVIRDTLLNASEANKRYIAQTCWSMSSQQAMAYALLSNVTSRDCVFGSVTASSVTFVIDLSTAMDTTFTIDGRHYTRLSYVQEHLSQVIGEQLKPFQKFNVITYGEYAYAVYSAPVYATLGNVRTILTFIAGLRTYGGPTAFDDALEQAFGVARLPVSAKDTEVIYLLSSSLPASNQVSYVLNAIPAWEAQRAPDRQIRIFSTAFLLGGNDSPTDKQQSAAFMEKLATITNGVYRNMDTQ